MDLKSLVVYSMASHGPKAHSLTEEDMLKRNGWKERLKKKEVNYNIRLRVRIGVWHCILANGQERNLL